MTCLLPIYWTVLPLSYFAYTIHAVKHKSHIYLLLQFTLKDHKNKQKNLNSSNKTRDSHGPFWTWFLWFLISPAILSHKKSARFPKLVRLLSTNSASFFALSLCPLNGTFWGKEFHRIFNGSDSLNTSLFLSIFS